MYTVLTVRLLPACSLVEGPASCIHVPPSSNVSMSTIRSSRLLRPGVPKRAHEGVCDLLPSSRHAPLRRLSTEAAQRLTHVVPWLSTCGANPSASPLFFTEHHGRWGVQIAEANRAVGQSSVAESQPSNHTHRGQAAVNWLSLASNCAGPLVRLCTCELRSSKSAAAQPDSVPGTLRPAPK